MRRPMHHTKQSSKQVTCLPGVLGLISDFLLRCSLQRTTCTSRSASRREIESEAQVHGPSLMLGSRGFTILEFMIATTVFSTMLLIASSAIIGVSRQFYKGLIVSRTQEVARTITEELAANIQYSASKPYQMGDEGSVKSWCVADRRYSYVLDQKVTDSNGGLVRLTSCTTNLTGTFKADANNGDVEMVGENMRLANLEILTDSTQKVWSFKVRVVYGDDDLLDETHSSCKAGIAGTEFCAVSEQFITVVRRL